MKTETNGKWGSRRKKLIARCACWKKVSLRHTSALLACGLRCKKGSLSLLHRRENYPVLCSGGGQSLTIYGSLRLTCLKPESFNNSSFSKHLSAFMGYSLQQVEAAYQAWGEHPWSYRLGCAVTFLGREGQLRRRAIEKLHLPSDGVVLDLACGTGLNFRYLEERLSSSGRIVAFDYSPAMLSAARRYAWRNGWENIEFVPGDAARLSLPYQVDGVLSTLGVSAIPDHQKALERSVHALKAGGWISILDAKLPSGVWQVFNPFLTSFYGQLASWDPAKDIPADLEAIIHHAAVEEHNGGTIYIVSGVKNSRI